VNNRVELVVVGEIVNEVEGKKKKNGIRFGIQMDEAEGVLITFRMAGNSREAAAQQLVADVSFVDKRRSKIGIVLVVPA
jgi:hypothetical protein